ncbi:YihY/virulence factor BrkB family protein [Actinomadura parmotrematis]|uniref:YihY/virulence factor BrkB family protein n=1 Tax=Actinomadura parmotrematis TaxID=2864039 RepID=A0ABS7G2L0_9ACTN|nr:YihY/virulence factor BrkB family protein [Actinomadura parmotrematis]MBW8486917.1 YihY/virulence factor BrkB family protein [Actinomadura parmotrematis]
MPQVVSTVQRSIERVTDAIKAVLRAARARWPWFDHWGRAYERYQDRRGDRLAAALTSYGFLSFFPLLALAYSLLGYLVGISDEARGYFIEAIDSILPGLSAPLQVDRIVQSKTTAGVIGLVGLLLTGLGWVATLRESLRTIWGKEPQAEGNFVLLKIYDVSVLLFLGAILMASVAVSSLASQATHTVLGWLGLEDVTGAGTVLWLLSMGVAVAFDTLIFLTLFSRLSGTRAPWRRILKGALFGGVGFEALKQVATLLLARTTSNPVYASFAVLVGLMVWINIVSRFVLWTAAWTATRSAILRADGTRDAAADADCADEAVREITGLTAERRDGAAAAS